MARLTCFYDFRREEGEKREERGQEVEREVERGKNRELLGGVTNLSFLLSLKRLSLSIFSLPVQSWRASGQQALPTEPPWLRRRRGGQQRKRRLQLFFCFLLFFSRQKTFVVV